MFVHDTKRIDELSKQRLQLDIWLNKHDNFQKSENMLFNFLNCDLKISEAIFLGFNSSKKQTKNL